MALVSSNCSTNHQARSLSELKLKSSCCLLLFHQIASLASFLQMWLRKCTRRAVDSDRRMGCLKHDGPWRPLKLDGRDRKSKVGPFSQRPRVESGQSLHLFFPEPLGAISSRLTALYSTRRFLPCLFSPVFSYLPFSFLRLDSYFALALDAR